MSNPLARRQFLAASALGAASTLGAPAIFAQSGTSKADELIVGVMGLSRGLSLANSFAKLPGVELKYVCDVDDYRTQAGADSIVGSRDRCALTYPAVARIDAIQRAGKSRRRMVLECAGMGRLCHATIWSRMHIAFSRGV